MHETILKPPIWTTVTTITTTSTVNTPRLSYHMQIGVRIGVDVMCVEPLCIPFTSETRVLECIYAYAVHIGLFGLDWRVWVHVCVGVCVHNNLQRTVDGSLLSQALVVCTKIPGVRTEMAFASVYVCVCCRFECISFRMCECAIHMQNRCTAWQFYFWYKSIQYTRNMR